MKYFSPSYWFKLWVLSAPLFKDKTQGINAMSIDNNQKIKYWANNNTNLQSINQELNFTNNTISNSTNNEIDHFYENFLKTQGWSKDPQIAQQQLIEIQEEHHDFLKQQHEKSRNRHKRSFYANEEIEFIDNDFFYKFNLNYNTEKKMVLPEMLLDYFSMMRKKLLLMTEQNMLIVEKNFNKNFQKLNLWTLNVN